MTATTTELDEVTAKALALAPADRVRLIQTLASSLFGTWVAIESEPARSLLGMCADLGPAPSAEEIDEARREAWPKTPREDVFG